jgi:hypothetical protein
VFAINAVKILIEEMDVGVHYQYMLCDQFDWKYSNSSKEIRLKKLMDELEKEGFSGAEILASFPYSIVLDLGKCSEFSEGLIEILFKNADAVYQKADYSLAKWKNLDYQKIKEDLK